MAHGPVARELLDRIAHGEVRVGVIGLGYVGLPLGMAFAEKGIPVLGYDIDGEKLSTLRQGRSYLRTVPSERLARAVNAKAFTPVGEIAALREADALLICVPTPLSKYREPDLSFVESTVAALAPHARRGQAVVLVSTTYPGTTDEIVRPRLEATGLSVGEDIFLIYAPEREDPGNPEFDTVTTPKIVGGENGDALAVGCALFGLVIGEVVPVGSLATAEAVKLTENIFRSVNIALVNELKILYDRMGIDIWEVIEAAKTKPFGYMAFYPGPGLGGHCIPIDPFYLTWKVREFGCVTRFIELAGEINNAMPEYAVRKLSEALDMRLGRGLKRARILLVGLAYKKNVDDTRESPSFRIMELLQARGAHVEYLDPYVPEIGEIRRYPGFRGLRSVDLDAHPEATWDAAIICTDHDLFNYEVLLARAKLVVDCRNATRNVAGGREKIVKA